MDQAPVQSGVVRRHFTEQFAAHGPTLAQVGEAPSLVVKLCKSRKQVNAIPVLSFDTVAPIAESRFTKQSIDGKDQI